jgi:L-asparaginase
MEEVDEGIYLCNRGPIAFLFSQTIFIGGPINSVLTDTAIHYNFTDIMGIRIFITGGTFDKEYNELTGQLYFKDSHLPEMLELGRNLVPIEIRTLMMVDSLEMSDDDRSLIAEHCIKSPEDKIIITHGTDTMAETAKVIANKIKNKTIVLTGAMVPYKFGSSDGLFNLGSAMAFVQTLSPGVYVVMNGRYFNANNVRKNKETGEFEEIQKP